MKWIVFQIILLFLVSSSLRSQESSPVPLRKWENEEQRLRERQNLSRLSSYLGTFLRQKQKPTSNILKSAILPGFGQWNAKKKVKGGIFMASSFISIGGGTYLLILSNQEYGKYKTADNIEDIENYYDNSVNLLKYSEIAFGVGGLIWVINIVDVFFTTKTYNRKLFEKFYYSLGNNTIAPLLGMKNGKINIGLVYKF